MAQAKPTTRAEALAASLACQIPGSSPAWPRWIAHDPAVSPWLLLDQLTAPQSGLPGRVQLRTGNAADLAIRQQSHS